MMRKPIAKSPRTGFGSEFCPKCLGKMSKGAETVRGDQFYFYLPPSKFGENCLIISSLLPTVPRALWSQLWRKPPVAFASARRSITRSPFGELPCWWGYYLQPARVLRQWIACDVRFSSKLLVEFGVFALQLLKRSQTRISRICGEFWTGFIHGSKLWYFWLMSQHVHPPIHVGTS